jgi:hypothetical protein
LAGRQLGAPGVTHEGLGPAHVRREPEIPGSQSLKCFGCGDH